ncbi:MAG: hypothetical protein WDN24_01930 [Sphingomonas sp.]
MEPELFRHVVGGYGLFGVILAAELEVVPNDIYRSERALIGYKEFPATFAKIQADPSIGLMYAHLSTAPGSLLDEALVYTYHKVDDKGLERAPLTEVGSTKMRRLTINLSKRGPVFASLKWWMEKNIEHRFESCTVTRAQAQGMARPASSRAMIRCTIASPICATISRARPTSSTNISCRATSSSPSSTGCARCSARTGPISSMPRSGVVDTAENALSYAPRPAFSVVLYLSQATDKAGNAAMAKLTSDLIDLAARHGGRFFLPYQPPLHAAQLERSYPEIRAFFAAKKRWDPEERFSNGWYARYAPALSAPSS